MLHRNGGYELWAIGWEQKNETATRARDIQLTVARGPSPERLGDRQVVEHLRPLLHDVTDPRRPGHLPEWRGMSRSYMIHDPQVGYILFGCVTAEYLPGRTSLLPAIVVSPDGRPGTWKYLGILQPEPRGESERRAHPVWSDGGGIVRLPDGRWRVYLNGYVRGIAAVEADRLEGPWKFLRDERGQIAVLAADDGIFPAVLRVSDHDWHLWISHAWPVREIRHLWSGDGLAWRPYGQQPEITRGGGPAIKCLRAYVADGGRQIAGLLSVQRRPQGEEDWVLYQSRMPAGPPPHRAE
jgi:hypothetical protein